MKHNAEFEFYGNSNNTGLLEEIEDSLLGKKGKVIEDYTHLFIECEDGTTKWNGSLIKGLIIEQNYKTTEICFSTEDQTKSSKELPTKETFKRLEFAKNNNTAEEFFTKLFEILNEPKLKK